MDSIWIIIIIGIIFRVLGKSSKSKKASQNQNRGKTPQQIMREKQMQKGAYPQRPTETGGQPVFYAKDEKPTKDQKIERKIQEARAQEAAKEAALESRWKREAPFEDPRPYDNARPYDTLKPYESTKGRYRVNKKSSPSPLEEIFRQLKEEVKREAGFPEDAAAGGNTPAYGGLYEAEKAPLYTGGERQGVAAGPEGRGAAVQNAAGNKPGADSPPTALAVEPKEAGIDIFKENFNKRDILNGIIMLEILGPPKALRRVNRG